MRASILSFLVLLSIAASSVNAFCASARIGVNGGSSFVQQVQVNNVFPTPKPTRGDMQMMGGKKAKFGVFSPAVYIAKFGLGQAKLNKIRGKGISLHSQAIGEFCQWAGAYHLRTKLIKLAKTNGDTLGFLV